MSSLGVSVAQAILQREGQSRLTTSSRRLDDAFVNGVHPAKGGIPRGTVGEIVGPPGIGKTTLALQIASNALRNGGSVVWIDTSSIFPQTRLQSILGSCIPESSLRQALSRFHSLSIRSLPLLLALLLHSAHTDTSIFATSADLNLLVIDDLSTPILATYPHGFEDDRNRPKSNRNKSGDSAAIKRINVLKELGNKLATLAAKRNIAILVLNQLTTKVIVGNNALLVPALGDAWTSVCSFRITLYRQGVAPDFCENAQDLRFAYFQKCEGIVVKNEDAKNVPFLITDKGIEDVVFPYESTPEKDSIPSDDEEPPVKRRRVLSVAEEIVDDSEGEDEDFLLTGIEDTKAENTLETKEDTN